MRERKSTKVGLRSLCQLLRGNWLMRSRYRGLNLLVLLNSCSTLMILKKMKKYSFALDNGILRGQGTWANRGMQPK